MLLTSRGSVAILRNGRVLTPGLMTKFGDMYNLRRRLGVARLEDIPEGERVQMPLLTAMVSREDFQASGGIVFVFGTAGTLPTGRVMTMESRHPVTFWIVVNYPLRNQVFFYSPDTTNLKLSRAAVEANTMVHLVERELIEWFNTGLVYLRNYEPGQH